MSAWTISGNYLTAMTRAMHSLDHFAGVRARVSPACAAALDSPHQEAWWPGEVLVELVGALGAPATKDVAIWASRESMGKMVRPLASVVLTLSKAPGMALFTRIGAFVGAGVKGITATFEPNADRSGGIATFTFPTAVPSALANVWAGFFDTAFSLTPGKVVRETLTPTTHQYEVSW
jgi:hypothetical protein